MKKIILAIILVIPIFGMSQNDYVKIYEEAMQFAKNHQVDSAYMKFKVLQESVPKSDTLYEHAVWYNTVTATFLEQNARSDEKFDVSLAYGLKALEAIRKGRFMFDEQFAKREYFMMKNITVSHFGLGDFEEGKKWKAKMYKAQKDSLLPKGLDEYFNFDFFKVGNKNVWGYEWFAELPENRFSSSFTKVVYYVYSTNADGSDKDQLYRLHVLMFHGDTKKFDYVLTKRMETGKDEFSGTLYQYTYKEDIDYKKLQKDVKDIVSGNMKSMEEYLEEKKKKKKKGE